MKYFTQVLFMLLLPLGLWGQTSVIRGSVVDLHSETPLIGVTIQVLGIEPAIGSLSDAEGIFEIKNVPVGRQAIRFSYLGYESQTLPNVLVTAGKELLLQVKLEETFTAINEVVISAQSEKDKTVNELATISARQFNTEEVSRYSGGRNDVARLVANFAGVAATNDARNDIVIRGNAPTGVLWRLEGIPIPSPNHYSTLGTTGGPVSALNPNMIGNSDFLTSAFPAEYGNATAGVFDIHLRQGNRERYEFMGQVGAFTGFEGAIEGPLRKGKGSMLIGYRHSFAEVAQLVGLNVGTTATPKYKDLTFNFDFGKTALGNISVFGIGGYSTIDFLGAEIDTTDLFAKENENAYNISKFGVLGVNNSILLNDHAYIRTVLSAAHSGNTYDNEDRFMTDETGALLQLNDVLDATDVYRVSSYYNNKVNRNFTLRTGILAQTEHLDSYVKTRDGIGDYDGDGRPDLFTQRDINGRFDRFEALCANPVAYDARMTLNTGVRSLYFNPVAVRSSGDGDLAIEPRVAVNWQHTERSRFNIGYGMHHQTQPLPVFLFRQRQPDGSALATNTDLGYTRSQHFVFGWDYKPSKDWRIKSELYYQLLNKVPIDSISSSFSLLNTGADFVFPEKNNLVNEGKGNNMGLELTIEKFFNRGWYSLITASLFDSKYKGSDDVSRNTAFNGRYVFNVLAGKEFNIGRSGRRVFTLDTKFTTAGGRPYTPVDLAASAQAGREVLIENEAFSKRLDDYFRWDVKMGVRLNSAKRKLSQTFFLDFQNVTNHQNIFAVRYNEARNEIGKTYQIGFFPDVMYRIEF